MQDITLQSIRPGASQTTSHQLKHVSGEVPFMAKMTQTVFNLRHLSTTESPVMLDKSKIQQDKAIQDLQAMVLKQLISDVIPKGGDGYFGEGLQADFAGDLLAGAIASELAKDENISLLSSTLRKVDS